MAGRPKGTPKTGGRKKGTPNKTTATIKDAITQAFDGIGGVRALIAWGTANPGLFFPLWARLAPAELNVKAEGFDALADALRRAEERTGANAGR